MKRIERMIFFLFFVVTIVSCSQGDSTRVVEKPFYDSAFDSLKHLDSAPPPIKNAAKAVVRVCPSDGSCGTGFFISDHGKLLTNEHVVGSSNCALGGCYVHLDFQFENGKKHLKGEYFFVPVFVSKALDLSVFQVYDSGTVKAPFHPPHFLEFFTPNKDLIHSKVYVVGHPQSGLKKWSQGEVIHTHLERLSISNLILPGNSGSPILNEDGLVVGVASSIYNTGPEGISRTGYRLASANGSLSKAFIERFQSNKSDHLTLINLEEPMSELEAVAHADIFWAAHRKMATLQGGRGAIEIPQLLKQQCENALAPGGGGTETKSDLFSACQNAGEFWLSCSARADSFQHCPKGEEKRDWIALFQKAMEREMRAPAKPSLDWVSYFVYRIAEDPALGITQAILGLRNALKEYDLPMSFQVAYYLSLFGSTHDELTWKGIHATDYILNFESHPEYLYHLGYLRPALQQLFQLGQLSSERLINSFERVLTHPQTTLKDYLQFESTLYLLR